MGIRYVVRIEGGGGGLRKWGKGEGGRGSSCQDNHAILLHYLRDGSFLVFSPEVVYVHDQSVLVLLDEVSYLCVINSLVLLPQERRKLDRCKVERLIRSIE